MKLNKVCNKCGAEKPYYCFPHQRRTCLECRKTEQHEYYLSKKKNLQPVSQDSVELSRTSHD